MDWLLLGRKPRLTHWLARPFTPGVFDGPRDGDKRDNHERVVAVEAPGPPAEDGPFRRVAAAIFSFRIFPPNVVTGVLAAEPVNLGDTVGACYHWLPGCRLLFAARVYECFDERCDGPAGELWRTGFSYRTLAGHPMCGEETFCVEKNMTTGQITAAVRSWSRPVHWTTRWGYPLARRWQLQAGRAALDHLQSIAGVPAQVPAMPLGNG